MAGHEKKQLGKILLQRKVVDASSLDASLAQQKAQPNRRLASVLASSGQATHAQLLEALSEQLGVPGFDIDQAMIALSCLSLIPVEIAKRHRVLPVAAKDDCIFLAMADPTERRTIDEIEFVTGMRVFAFVALAEPLRQLIDDVYRMYERGEIAYVGASVPPALAESRLSSLRLDRNSHPPSMRPAPPRVVSVRPPAPHGLDELSGVGRFESELRDSRPPALKTTHPRIVVVDDEEDLRVLLVRALDERGYQTFQASRGLEALEVIRSASPDLILLDAQLPEVHGFDICRRLRASQRYANVPVVLMSAVYRGWRVAADLQSTYGVSYFLEKPFSLQSLFEIVERALGERTSSPDMSEHMSAEAQVRLDAGLAAYERGEHQEAIEQLKAAVAIDGLAFRLQYHLGLLLGQQDETLFEGITCLERALELSPRSFSAAKNLAVLYERAGFVLRASELWQRAIGLCTDAKIRENIKEHLLRLL